MDVLLWGTRYATHPSYFEETSTALIRNRALSARCGCLFRNWSRPTCISRPWVLKASVLRRGPLRSLRSVMSHIRGMARLDMEQLGHITNHFDIAQYLSQRDSGTSTKDRGWDYFRHLALTTPDDRAYPIP